MQVPDSVALWQQAASFAARQHRNQFRRDGKTPYVAHLFRVAMTVRQLFECDDAATLAAALLHDTIEDTTTDYEDIEHRFGDEVARAVAALTKNMALPEAEREREYDSRIVAADWKVRLVKAADTFDNLSDALAMGDNPVKVADHIEKAERALHMIAVDTERHAPSRVAASMLEALISSAKQAS